MRELRRASLRLIIFMSMLAGCGAAISRTMLVIVDPAVASMTVA